MERGTAKIPIRYKYFIAGILIFNWAMLLSARMIAAAIISSGPASYDSGLRQIGFLMPFCAWAALASGLAILFSKQLVKGLKLYFG